MSRGYVGALALLSSLLLAGCGGSSSSKALAPPATGSTPPPSFSGGLGGSSTSSTPPSGGGSSSSSTTPPPSSGGSTGSGGSTSSGSSAGSGSSGGSGTSTGSEQPQTYIEALLPIGPASGGVAEVNPNGVGNSPAFGRYSLTLALGSAADTYTARFCPFAGNSCITITDQPTFRNSGGVQFAGMFPSHGAFSGEFIISKNGADAIVTGFTAPPNGSVINGNPLEAQLVRASEVSGGLGMQAQFGIGTDPLASGSAVVSQPAATVKATVSGAAELTTYTVSYCDPAGAKCVELGTLTTDVSGNGSASLSVSPAQSPGNVNSGQFKLSRSGANGPVEFISGFVVP